MQLTRLFREFWKNERSGGVVLVLCTVLSLALTNSAWGEAYVGLWHLKLAGQPVEFWINDGLMAVFFLMVGLELKRELLVGELSRVKHALLPAMAALGGMLVPAGIHFILNHGTATASGAGIPMATDIAFAIGILSLLGDRVPVALKVFLTALAVIDDLGAIIAIALFYSTGVSWADLSVALTIFLLMLSLDRMRVGRLWVYLVLGVVMWVFMLRSGVHPSITGVLVAFAIPFNSRKGIAQRLEDRLHEPVAFFIMPVFALANTCIHLDSGWASDLFSSNSMGVFLGLVLGKPLGITLFTAIAVAVRLCALPRGTRWIQVIGLGFLGGIGFTMSIFITLLAFNDQTTIMHAKTAILISSTVAALIGLLWLKAVLPPAKVVKEEEDLEVV
jgi:NhaA family Na+:H+ antiporter